jgi:hypothetical protein
MIFRGFIGYLGCKVLKGQLLWFELLYLTWLGMVDT